MKYACRTPTPLHTLTHTHLHTPPPTVYYNIIYIGLLCDLLWSDPDKEVMGWGENDRGVSFTFGPEIVSKFLAKHDMDLICRAHQVSLSNQVKSNREFRVSGCDGLIVGSLIV